MNYKKIALVLLVLLLALSMVSAKETILSKANEFRIDLLRYDPSPVEPGKPSDIWFEITNLGDEAINNFEITLAGGSTGLLKSDMEKLNFGRLAAGEKITFAFTITPNSEIIDGDYILNLEYFSKKLDSITSEPFTIKVKRVNRDVSATSTKIATTKIDTGMLVQGEPSELALTIHNSAEYIMKDITVSLELSSTTIPIAPIWTTSETKIAAINPRQSTDVKFNLIALPDAASGIYKVPLTIKYYDEIGNNYTKNDLIGIIIDGEPEIHVEIKDNNIYSRWGTGEVTLNIVNKGLAKVKLLTAELKEPKDTFKILWKEYPTYTILSENKVYLGDIDSDDDESVEYLLKLKAPAGAITLPLTIEYRDANNKQHTETFDIDVDIHSETTLGLKESSYFWKIAGLFILIFFLLKYKAWKKQSNKKGILEYLKYLVGKLSRKND